VGGQHAHDGQRLEGKAAGDPHRPDQLEVLRADGVVVERDDDLGGLSGTERSQLLLEAGTEPGGLEGNGKKARAEQQSQEERISETACCGAESAEHFGSPS
jgi:hypothetical protein